MHVFAAHAIEGAAASEWQFFGQRKRQSIPATCMCEKVCTAVHARTPPNKLISTHTHSAPQPRQPGDSCQIPKASDDRLVPECAKWRERGYMRCKVVVWNGCT